MMRKMMTLIFKMSIIVEEETASMDKTGITGIAIIARLVATGTMMKKKVPTSISSAISAVTALAMDATAADMEVNMAGMTGTWKGMTMK
jgi:hypothetical protein